EWGGEGGGEPGEMDSDDLPGRKELVETAAEMAARFDDDRARPAEVETHHLEKDRIGALHPVRDDDDGDSADPEGGAGTELEPQSGIDAAPPDATAVGECDNRCR